MNENGSHAERVSGALMEVIQKVDENSHIQSITPNSVGDGLVVRIAPG